MAYAIKRNHSAEGFPLYCSEVDSTSSGWDRDEKRAVLFHTREHAEFVADRIAQRMRKAGLEPICLGLVELQPVLREHGVIQ